MTFKFEVGPVLLVQVVSPETPVTTQVGVPIGDAPPVGPVTVAVNVMDEPKVAVDAPLTTETVGVPLATVTVLGLPVAATEL